jgi:hypothetical protein
LGDLGTYEKAVITMDNDERGCEGVDWIQPRVLVTRVMNLQVL